MSKNEIIELYKICKEDLKTRRKNIRYCNYSFFEKFVEYQRLAFLAAKDSKYNDEYKSILKSIFFRVICIRKMVDATVNFYLWPMTIRVNLKRY